MIDNIKREASTDTPDRALERLATELQHQGHRGKFMKAVMKSTDSGKLRSAEEELEHIMTVLSVSVAISKSRNFYMSCAKLTHIKFI